MKIAVCDARDLQQAGAQRASVHKLSQQLGSSKQSKGGNNCHQCEGSHDLSQRCFCDAECHACGKKGHIKRACRSRLKTSPTLASAQGMTQPVHRTEEETLIETQEYRIYPLQDPATRPWKTTVRVAGHDVIMEVDTEISVTVVSEATLGRIWVAQPAPPLQLTDVSCRGGAGKAGLEEHLSHACPGDPKDVLE